MGEGRDCFLHGKNPLIKCKNHSSLAAASAKKRGKNEKEEKIYIKNRSVWELESFGSFLHGYYIPKILRKKVGKY